LAAAQKQSQFKANSNPIQSQFMPKQTQFKANKAKNKPNLLRLQSKENSDI